MITLITQKSTKKEYWHNSIFDNIPSDRCCQLDIMISIINAQILTTIILQKNYKEKDKVGKFNGIDILYEDSDFGKFYIAFYDTILDSVWEKECEKKYGEPCFVYDEETPMLRFSKENFEHTLRFWETVKDSDPEYYIITQDDTGWIDVRAENELSSDQLRMVSEYQERRERMRQEERIRDQKRNKEIN